MEQTLHREQVITRAGAASIESFLVLVGKSLSIAAGDKQVESQEYLQTLVDRWEETPLVGVILTDKEGKVVGGANQARAVVDLVSVADRDYFVWAKTAEAGSARTFGSVLSRTGQSKGNFIMTIASPVVDKGGFKGVLTAAVVLSSLTEQYLSPLKFSTETGVHLVDDQGTMLYSSVGPKTGENILTYILEHPFLGSSVVLQKAEEGLKKGVEGKLDLVWPGEGGWRRNLVAYSPIKIDEGRWWYLVLTTSVDDALAFVGPLYMRIVVTFAAVFLALLAYAVRLARYFSFREAQKYEHLTHGIKE